MSDGGHSGGRRLRQALLGYLLVLPAVTTFAVFAFYPLVKVVWIGMHETPPFPNLPARFVGLSQYGNVLGSTTFEHALITTLIFCALTVPAGLGLGMALALLAHQRLPGIGIFRTIFSSTVATSTAVASVIFFTLLDPEVGILAYWFGTTGGTGILGSPTWALPAVSLVTTWANLGFTFILMSAALQSLPEDVLEAASVDGSSPAYRFFHVTLPLLSPSVFLAAIVATIGSFQAFGQIDILTGGGPGDHTTTLMYAIYLAAFQNGDSGQAAVIAVALFGIIVLLTALQFRFFGRRVFYGR